MHLPPTSTNVPAPRFRRWRAGPSGLERALTPQRDQDAASAGPVHQQEGPVPIPSLGSGRRWFSSRPLPLSSGHPPRLQILLVPPPPCPAHPFPFLLHASPLPSSTSPSPSSASALPLPPTPGSIAPWPSLSRRPAVSPSPFPSCLPTPRSPAAAIAAADAAAAGAAAAPAAAPGRVTGSPPRRRCGAGQLHLLGSSGLPPAGRNFLRPLRNSSAMYL